MSNRREQAARATEYSYPGERDELIAELNRERQRADFASSCCDEMAARLNRLDEHLRRGALFDVLDKLANYAGAIGHDEADNPAPDPFPDPEPPKKPKRTRRSK